MGLRLYKYIIKTLTVDSSDFGITLLVFTIMSLAPGEPGRIILGERASEEAVYELNKNWVIMTPSLCNILTI